MGKIKSNQLTKQAINKISLLMITKNNVVLEN